MPLRQQSLSPKAEGNQTQCESKKVCRPVGWEEEVDGVKQACWCGKEWYDNHEDANHEDVWVEAEVVVGGVLGKRGRDDEESEESELEEGWQLGWYGPVRCEE